MTSGCWGRHQGVGAGHHVVGEDMRVLAGHQGVGGTSGC